MLWDSLAIVEFLAEAHPDKHVYPSAPAARAWARSAVAEMHAGFEAMPREMGMNVGVRVALEEWVVKEKDGGALGKEMRRLDELWSDGLRKFGGPWLAGKEWTAVDAFYAPMVVRLQTYGQDRRFSTAGQAYVKRVLEVEGVKDWVAAALKETAREELHDKESMEGKGRGLVKDLRAV